MIYSAFCISASLRDAIFVAPRFNVGWEICAIFNCGIYDIIMKSEFFSKKRVWA